MSNKFLKQKKVGNWLGGVKQVFGQLNMYLAFINLILIAVTAWNTTLSEWLSEAGINIPFWVFGLFIVLFLLTAMLFEYKVTIPSFFSFWNSQFWAHDNPLRKEIEILKEQISDIKNPDWNLIQTKNPVSKRWVLINKATGTIMGGQDDEFVGVPKADKR